MSSRLAINIRPATKEDVPIMARQQITMAEQTEGRDLTPAMLAKGLTLGLNRKLSYVQLFVAETQCENNTNNNINETNTTNVSGNDENTKKNIQNQEQQQEQQEQKRNTEICGMIMIRPEFSLLRNSSVYSLEDVFTEEKFRGKGVFRQLYNQIRDTEILDVVSQQQQISTGKTKDFCGMRLFVDKENDSAIACYKKVGMYLEKGRPFRWCKKGSEAPRKDPSEAEQKRISITPLETRKNDEADAFAKECIHRCTPSLVDTNSANNESEEKTSLIDNLVEMIWNNSKNHHRFANEITSSSSVCGAAVGDAFEKKFKKETLKAGVMKAIRSSTFIVDKKNQNKKEENTTDDNTTNDLPAEFYIITSSSSSSSVLGCFMLTYEFCTWRRGFIIWIQNFSVSKNEESRREFLFRSVIRWAQKKVEEDEDVDEVDETSEIAKIPFSGVRFELDPELEEASSSSSASNLVKVAEEEAFEFEDDVQMRVELL